MENSEDSKSDFKLPNKSDIKLAMGTFSKKEWKVFFVLLGVLVISTLFLLQKVNTYFMVSVPKEGGSISEGIIGTPRFINPVLASTDADRDLTTLVYSGLLRKSGTGEFIPDLAEKYEVSKNGLTYTFTLKENLTFQDGTELDADDVVFTINAVKDPIIKSPKRGNWDGITVEKLDERTVQFNLKQPYASFLENATFGIMPEAVWANSAVELNEANINPIGSGPYMIKNANKQSDGVINSYDLKPFKKFALGTPHIANITLKFYPNEEELVKALKNGAVDQASSISPKNAKTLEGKYKIMSSTLPRIFGLFFNQSQNQLFTNKNVMSAINEAIDKDKIVEEVLLGYGLAIDDPIPGNIVTYQKLDANNLATHEEKLAKAKSILERDGWKKNAEGFLEKTAPAQKAAKGKTAVPGKTTALEFSISTGNAPELKNSAEIIKANLAEIGINVTVKPFELGDLNQSVIRPRKYETLLFGQIINRESDLFAFWHSSQRKDPGLNVALYTNAKVDKILEDAFVTIDKDARIKKYAQFEDEIKRDLPAVFLYSPDLIYVVSKNLEGQSIEHIVSPAERFNSVYLWYTETDNVWKIFAPTH